MVTGGRAGWFVKIIGPYLGRLSKTVFENHNIGDQPHPAATNEQAFAQIGVQTIGLNLQAERLVFRNAPGALLTAHVHSLTGILLHTSSLPSFHKDLAG